MARIRDPEEKEKLVYDFLGRFYKKTGEPASFHQIQRELTFTSGTLQSTIARCLKPKSKYRIYESLKYSKLNQRTQRVFSLQPPISNAPSVPDLEHVIRQLKDLNQGLLIDLDEEIILPLKLPKSTVKILQELLLDLPEFKSLGKLFSAAIQTYLHEHISPKLIQNARNRVISTDQMEVNING